MDVAGLDFNLLVPLQALLECRHVTRAAERIHLSQSAMSATLGRLRRHFDDELLVRGGSTYTLTPLARRLLPLVNEAVRAAENALGARSDFAAADSDRRFVVTASTYAAGVVGPPLRAHLAEHAPGVVVEFHAMPRHALAERDVLESDLLIGPTGYGLPGVHRTVFTDDFVCLLDASHPIADEPELTTQMLAGWPHAGVSFAPNLPTAADRLLDSLGVERHVAVLAEDWLPLPWLIRSTDLVTVLPRRVATWAGRGGDFALHELPGDDRAPFSEAAFWHPSRTGDPGLQWLTDALLASMRAAADGPGSTAASAGSDRMVPAIDGGDSG
jgi:DNA-binding transcriptional LysR family regulator